MFPDDCGTEPDSGLLLADGLEPPLFSRETVEAEQAECWDSEGWRDGGRKQLLRKPSDSSSVVAAGFCSDTGRGLDASVRCVFHLLMLIL